MVPSSGKHIEHLRVDLGEWVTFLDILGKTDISEILGKLSLPNLTWIVLPCAVVSSSYSTKIPRYSLP